MVKTLRYSAMCTNDEHPILIDTKMYLFHVAYHARGIVADFGVR